MKRYVEATKVRKIKLTDEDVALFFEVMDELDEFVFGDETEVKAQLEHALNTQGYWSGVQYRIYFDAEDREFWYETKHYGSAW